MQVIFSTIPIDIQGHLIELIIGSLGIMVEKRQLLDF